MGSFPLARPFKAPPPRAVINQRAGQLQRRAAECVRLLARTIPADGIVLRWRSIFLYGFFLYVITKIHFVITKKSRKNLTTASLRRPSLIARARKCSIRKDYSPSPRTYARHSPTQGEDERILNQEK